MVMFIWFGLYRLSMKFILLINVKMPTIVGILTVISMINTSERLKANFFSFVSILVFRAVEISCSIEHEKSFIASGPG